MSRRLRAMGVRRLARFMGIAGFFAVAALTAVSAPQAAALDAQPSQVPTEASGSIGLRLLEQPAGTGDNPRASLYVIDHLAPGTVIERQIEVSNTTESTLDVSLYPAAASIANGTFIGADGRTPNDLSTWTSVSPHTLDLPSGGHATATVTIAVPTDAAPGERYAVVWAEARSGPGAGGLVQASRVGIRVYLSVGPGGPPAADFVIESLTAARSPSGQPVVLASVHNTGGRALDISGILHLTDGPGDLSAGPFAVNLGATLGIDETEPVTVTLDAQLPAGPWDAQITLRSGLVERTARATLTFPESGTAGAVSTTQSSGPFWPTVSLGGLILALAAFWLLVRARRRERRRVRSQAEAPRR